MIGSRVVAVDEALLVWAAALVEGADPATILATVDVAALAHVVAEAEAEGDPVDAAAALLVATVRRRPFLSSNAAIGWLAAVDLLAAVPLRLAAPPEDVVELGDRIRAGEADAAETALTLRRWLVLDGLPCPACGRRVYALEPLARRSLQALGGGYELTARCAVEHGGHDRSGRPLAPPAARAPEPRQPVLARGACGSFLVAGERGTVAVSPFCDEPPIVRVVQVDELRAGDLVGRWDALVERSRVLGFVPAEEAAPDEGGRVDLSRLGRALRAGARS